MNTEPIALIQHAVGEIRTPKGNRYPSYVSKWNPIEHRLFPHITQKLKGVTLKSVEQ
ncbi:MAG: hypothetical protein GXP17_02220 [Gammaproteobacteria bacterium]|nr:hypothetical protein [Gammaproteobacteria bacterium]